MSDLRKYAGFLRSNALWAGIAGLLALVLAGSAFGASFKVSPTRFEFSLDKRFTNFFTVSNNSGESLRIRAFTSFLDVDEGNKLVPVKDHPLDLSKYVVINPRRFTLGNGQSRNVRFSVRPPRDIPPGEYRVVVFFDELPRFSGKQPKKSAGPPRGLGSVRIRLLTRLGITLYGMKGDRQIDAFLENAKVVVEKGQLIVTGKAVNQGNARAQLFITASVERNGKPRQEPGQTRIVVQRSQWREFRIVLPAPPKGSYQIRLKGSHKDEAIFDTLLPFNSVPSAQ